MIGSVSSLPLIAALPLAVAAGFVSFISPCVLPLLPGYLAFLSGATGSIEGRSGRGRAVLGSLAFVFGFALVFVGFGALFGGLGGSLQTHQRTLEIAFGLVTVLLGLFFAGWWPSSWLQRDRRMHRLPKVSILGAAMLGFLFALGWTPCIGPTLGAILGLAASSSGTTALRGSILAFFYCLGLGIPFVVAALASEWMTSASAWLRRHHRVIGRVGGVLLIVIGICEVTGAWHSFVLWLQTHFPSSNAIL
jgi:cytochrome c-type biogenesis protein